MNTPYHSDGLKGTPYAKARKPRRLGNYFKTTLLLAFLSALFLAVGQRLGGGQGLMLAGVFVVGMNFFSWWFSDKLALAMNGAKPVEPSELPWLHQMVEDLAKKAGLPKPKVYMMRSAMPNGFATGRDPKHAAVAVTTGILDLLTPRELSGVLAHELAHIKNRDTLIGTIAATMAGIISQAARLLFWFGGALGGGDRDRDNGSALASLGLMLVAPIAATLIQLAISRSREYGADAIGGDICGDPDALADALAKLEGGVRRAPDNHAPATASLFIINPLKGAGIASLFSTHPPTEERIRRLRAFAREVA